MTKFFLALAVLWGAHAAHADLITLSNGKTEKEGVNISTGAVVSLENHYYQLTTAGSGVRKKKVVIVPINVYVAQLLVTDEPSLVRSDDGIIPSFDHQAAAAMHMTFLRDVPIQNIKESFLSGLEVNGVDTKSPDIVNFMKAIEDAGAAEAGGSMTIFVAKGADGLETVAIENKVSQATVKSFVAGPGMMKKLMSIWLGVPSDTFLADLKKEILN